MKTTLGDVGGNLEGRRARCRGMIGLTWTILTLGAVGGEGPEAREILERHLQAIGPRAALEKVRTEAIKGSASERGREFGIEILIQAPDRLLFTASVEGGFTIRMALSADGKGWREEPGGFRRLEGETVSEIYEQFLPWNVPALLRLADAAAGLETLEPENQGAQTLNRVRLMPAQGPARELKFAADTGLLVQNGKSDLSDYRSVEGIRLPFQVNGADGLAFRISEVAFNVAVKDGTFDKPAGVEIQTGKNAYRTQLSPPGQLAIVRRPPAMNFGRGARKNLPAYNPDSPDPFQIDLRGNDCSSLDLADRTKDLLQASFDDRTKWPETLPAGFDPKAILASGKNPGLRVRELHREGITGKGVGVAIVDQNLLVDHIEYADRLRLYEEIHVFGGEPWAAMHGPAVASLAVGKTVGAAPEADLYYIAETHGELGQGGQFEWDFTWVAKSIERVLEVNESLPADRKIRVISISVGWSSRQKGYESASAAVDHARASGVFVISTSLEDSYRLAFHGLGRSPLDDPDDYRVYRPGSWWARSFYEGTRRFGPGERLLVPMDARCVASPTGAEEYVFYGQGGWSWSVPYLAGLYALACQVRPDVTPEHFWDRAMKTGNNIQLPHGDGMLDFGTIVDPVALIQALKSERQASDQPAR